MLGWLLMRLFREAGDRPREVTVALLLSLLTLVAIIGLAIYTTRADSLVQFATHWSRRSRWRGHRGVFPPTNATNSKSCSNSNSNSNSNSRHRHHRHQCHPSDRGCRHSRESCATIPVSADLDGRLSVTARRP